MLLYTLEMKIHLLDGELAWEFGHLRSNPAYAADVYVILISVYLYADSLKLSALFRSTKTPHLLSADILTWLMVKTSDSRVSQYESDPLLFSVALGIGDLSS